MVKTIKEDMWTFRLTMLNYRLLERAVNQR